AATGRAVVRGAGGRVPAAGGRVQAEVVAPLELAERVVDQLDAVALGALIGGQAAVRGPRVGAGVGRAGDDGLGRHAERRAAAEQDDGDGRALAGVVPLDVEWLANRG